MKRRLNKLIFVSILAVLAAAIGLTATAYAGVPDRNGNVHFAAGETVDHTLFAAGRQITIDANVEGDVFCAGQHVTITGQVAGDIMCAAQTIVISGQVDGDVRLAAQNVTLSGHVDGSMSAAGQTVSLDVKGGVNRDAHLAGNDVTINGAVGRDISVAGANTYINSTVGRNIEAHGEQLTLGKLANVSGNVTHESWNDAKREQGSTVTGQVSRRDPPRHDENKAAGAAFGFNLFMVIALLLTAVVLAALLPRFFWRVSDIADRKPLKTLLVGFVASLVVPMVIVLLMLTLVGIPLGLLALLIWFVMVLLSGPVAAFSLGRAIAKNSTNAVVTILAGSAVIAVLYLIPVISIITGMFVVWFGLGALVRYLWGLRAMPAVSLADSTTKAALAPPEVAPKANNKTEVKRTKASR